MNILILAHYQDDGSPYGCFIHEQSKAFKALGHNVRVVSSVVAFKKYLNADLYKNSFNIVDGIPVYYVRHLSFSHYGKYGLNDFMAFCAIKNRWSEITKDFSPDVIHAHMIDSDGAIGVRLKRKYGLPLVITTHGSDTSLEIEKGKNNQLVTICRQADTLIAVSVKLKEQLINLDHSLPIEVIHNGFAIEHCCPSKKQMYSIISVGSLEKQKRFDITIKAFHRIVSFFPAARLVIVGTGNEEHFLKQLSSTLGVADKVIFTGQLSNLEVFALMSTSHLFVLPSVQEGFGIVYLEAMGSGCVTIGTEKEGISDILIHEKNGILVPPDNDKVLSCYIQKCFTDFEYCQNLALNAQKTAATFTWENNAKNNILVMKKVGRNVKRNKS